MTIKNCTIEFSTGAEYKFVRNPNIGVLGMTHRRAINGNSIENCLQVITGNISELFEHLTKLNLSKRIIFFVRTQSFQDPNVLTRRKRLWGSSDFSWILNNYKKTKDSEKTDNTGKYYIGFAEIQSENLFEALNYSRLSSRAVVIFTNDIEADDSLLEFTDKMIDSKREMMNWSEVIDFFCLRNNIILKVFGGFDDREVSVDFFMDKTLLDKISQIRW
jgi:hypothetical protein